MIDKVCQKESDKMYQTYTAKHLRKNDDFIRVLENLIGTSRNPKRLLRTNRIITLRNCFENFYYKGKHVKSEDLKNRLEKWAKENEMVIIATSCAMIIFCASLDLEKLSTITMDDSIPNDITTFLNKVRKNNDTKQPFSAGFYLESEDITKAEYPNQNVVFSIPSDILGESSREDITTRTETYIQEQTGMIELQKLVEESGKEEKAYIQLYSDIFGLDYEKVYQILSNITGDFQNEAYIANYIIGDSSLKNRTVTCTSKEMAILIAVRNIYWSPEKYGYPYDDLKTGIEYVSDLGYSKQIAYLSNVLGVDPVLHYAICKLECNFNSPLFMNKHNPAGLRFTSGSYTAFPSATAGFIEQALELLKYQIDGRTSITSIGEKHAPTSDSANASWASSVTSIYHSAMKNYETLFGGDIELTPKEPSFSLHQIEQSYIHLYSDIYGLNFEKVYQILSDITDDFKNEAYITNNVIHHSKLDGQIVICNSKEMAILLAVRDIYFYPERYGYTSEELKTGIPYKTELKLASQIFYVSNVLEVDPALTYAICQAHGNFNHPMFLLKNNPNNMKLDDTFSYYPSTMAGFIEKALEVLKCKMSGQAILIGLGLEHSRPLDSNWVSNVIFIYNYVMEHYDIIFDNQLKTGLANEKVYILY
ncbi:MAG: hypothetical protein HFH08_03945 [Bacilli bacterium]|nr:hypothetical protein [Bacilli bacterium]